MQNPYEQFVNPSARPVVLGTPQPRQPAPVRPLQEQIERQQLENAGLEEERKRQEIAEAARKAAEPPKDAKLVESERTAAFLATRVKGGILDITEALRAAPDAAKPTVAATFAGSFGDIARNLANPSSRQRIEAAQADVLDAALTLGTGAAYTREQLEGYRKAYFPQIGDSADTVRDKQQRLIRVLEAAKVKAGSAAPQIDEALAAVTGQSPTPTSLPFKERNDLFQQKIRSGAPYDEVARYAGELGLEFNPDELKRAIGRKDTRVVGNEQGVGSRLWDATTNALAGVGEGAAAIIDIPTRALGAGLGEVADFFGLESVADNLRNPITIGGTIEAVRPVPEDDAGWWARQASRLTGGAAALPRAATTAIAEQVAGKVPLAPARAPSAFTPVGKAAKDLDIRVAPAFTGGPVTRAMSAFSAQTPVGAAFAGRAASNTSDDAARALSRTASNEGAIVNAETAGETATRGALAYRNTSRTAASGLYDQAAKVAGDARVVPTNTVAALERNIAELAENPAGADSLPYLTGLRDTLVQRFPDGVTVRGIRDMRTSLRDKFFKDGLRGSDIERRVMQAVDSVADDLAESLSAANKSEAAALFRQADAAWATRVKTIDDFIMPIIGRKGQKSGEEVFRSLEQAAKSNGDRLRSFVRALPPQDAGTVRASMINALGRARSGAAEDFSLDTFLTRWKDMGDTAKNALFTGEGRTALDKLAIVAQAGKRAGRYSNTSNTSGPLLAAGTVVSAGFGYQTFGATLLAEGAMGALLSSPKVAQGIARVAGSRSPREAEGAIKNLSVLAARNPALAEDIGSLQQRLVEAFTASPATSAAAQQNE